MELHQGKGGSGALAGWTDTATSHRCAALRVQSHGDGRCRPLAHLSTTVASLQFLIDKNGCVVKRYGPMEEPLVGACLGSPLGGGWDRGTEAPGREGQKGKGLGEAAGIFLFVSPALLLAPWEASPWLEFFLLSDPGNPGYLCRALQGFIS